MNTDQHSRRILILLWVLVSFAVVTGIIINSLIGNAISAQNRSYNEIDSHNIALVADLNELRAHFRATQSGIVAISNTDIDIPDDYTGSDDVNMVELIQSIQSITNEDNFGGLMEMTVLVEGLAELKTDALFWRYRYDELAADIQHGLSRQRARDILLSMREKIIRDISLQQIARSATKPPTTSETEDVAGEMSQLLDKLTEFERLVEAIGTEGDIEKLWQLRDKGLYPVLNELQELLDEAARNNGGRPLIPAETIANLKAIVFGESGTSSTEPGDATIPRSQGLYSLYLNHLELLRENTETQRRLIDLENRFDIEADLFLAAMQEIKDRVTHKASADLEQTWENALMLSAFSVLVFLLIALRISVIVRQQLAILVGLKHKSEAANKAKTEFLATMSHEIRTPLNGVLGMAELLSFSELNKKQQHYVARIRQTGQHLLTLINQMLDFTRVESGEIALDVHDFDIAEVLVEISGLMQKQVQDKNNRLVINVPQQQVRVRGDSYRLRQVLLNIIGNAIKFTSEGVIEISFKVVNNIDGHVHVYFEVSDTGIGMAPQVLDRIFEVFTQADSSTTREYGGSGLGLSISKRIIELMDGSINVSSEPDEGTTVAFTVALQAVAA